MANSTVLTTTFGLAGGALGYLAYSYNQSSLRAAREAEDSANSEGQEIGRREIICQLASYGPSSLRAMCAEIGVDFAEHNDDDAEREERVLSPKLMGDVREELLRELRKTLKGEVEIKVRRELREELRQELRGILKQEVGIQVRDELQTELRQSLRGEVGLQVRGVLRAELQTQFEGNPVLMSQIEREARDCARRDLMHQVRNEVRAEMKQEIRNELTRSGREVVLISEAMSDIRAEVKANLRLELRSAVQRELRVDLRGEVERELRHELRSEAKRELKSELKHEVKMQLGNETQAEVSKPLPEEMRMSSLRGVAKERADGEDTMESFLTATSSVWTESTVTAGTKRR